MREVDWASLRVWNNSQNTAFEVLCCQLAGFELDLERERFFRKGTPDGGVECYWIQDSGEEWAWQAKFFRQPPSDGQWADLDRSVETALQKHPRLAKYYVCLPQDRADPRRDDAKFFMDRWNDRVKKWQGRAADRGMSVEFAYWGDHEILERLSREEHRGRTFFWFERVAFSERWFSERLEETIDSVGVRYTAGFNVDLPIARLFDGLLRNEAFYGRMETKFRELKRRYEKVHLDSLTPVGTSQVDAVRSAFHSLLELLHAIKPDLTVPIKLEGLLQASEVASRSLLELQEAIRRANVAARAEKRPEGNAFPGRSEKYQYDSHSIERLLAAIREFESWCVSDEARLANLPAMLLLGEAGAGKTHLLCDVARGVVEAGGPAVVLLGGQLSGGEPWPQITGLLDLDCTRDEFLGALDAAADASGRRALLVIDALNESDHKERWSRHLAAMIRAVSRFPRIAFVISVRSSYEDLIVPEGLAPDRLVPVRHQGFVGREYEAARAFFSHYRLVRPDAPLLLPEFRNPLFLSLFCKGIAARPGRRVPSGMEGITSIFSHFVDDVNARLARPAALDFDARSHLVRRAIEGLGREMAETGSRSVPRDRAREIVGSFLPRDDYERSLFRHLLSEGILVENRAWSSGHGHHEVVQFGYERFGDHAVARYLLDTHLDPENPAAVFAPGGVLARYFSDQNIAWTERGLIEAFAIQLSERTGLELAQVAPSAAEFEPVRAAFVESLIWRRPDSIREKARELVRQQLSADHESRGRMLDVLVRIGTMPDHPLGAGYLHQLLLRADMPRRDGWWAVFLHEQWEEQGAVRTLIDWAWSGVDRDRTDSGSRQRAGILLGWFLCCPNRFIRDRATKALVGLFDRHLGALPELLEAFRHVDDPYVTERLLAVAYGCALRSPEDQDLPALVDSVFGQVFAAGDPPANILLRDYARGVVELALANGWSHPDYRLAFPPYRSTWDPNLPTEQELRTRVEGSGDRKLDIAGLSIVSSIMGHGDFGLYVIGTNAGGLPWLSVPLGEPITRAAKYRLAAFQTSLSDVQRELLETHTTLSHELDRYERLTEAAERHERETVEAEAPPSPEFPSDGWEPVCEDEGEVGADPDALNLGPYVPGFLDRLGLTPLLEEDRIERFSSGELARLVAESERTFRGSLSPEQLMEYEAVGRFADRRFDMDRSDQFDLDLVQRWVANRALELGWDHRLHGWFDNQVQEYDRGRDAHKPERIGKKYQWISYYECLARIADNFHFSDPDEDGAATYEGPWQLRYVRNIDPSWLRPLRTEGEPGPTKPSWFSLPKIDWDAIADDRAWLHSVTDMPVVPRLIETTDKSGASWLTLTGRFDFRQEGFRQDRTREYPFREVWSSLKSYLVRSKDVGELLAWANGQDLTNNRLETATATDSIYYGEIFRSRAFNSIETPYHGFSGWTKELISGCPVELHATTVSYAWEGNGYDCSVDDTFQVRVPSRPLYDAMGLRSRGAEGLYFDQTGLLVARDTAVDHDEPDALVVRRGPLERFLTEGAYSIVWGFTGEKHIVRGDHFDEENYAGRLLVSGFFHVRDGSVCGAVSPLYQNRKGTEVLEIVESD